MTSSTTTDSKEMTLTVELQVDDFNFSKSRNGEAILSSSALTGSDWRGQLCLISIQSENTLTVKRKIELIEGCASVDWLGKNESAVIVAGDDGSIHIIDIGGKKERFLRILNEHDGVVSKVRRHPENETLIVSGSWDSTLKLWNGDAQSTSVRTFCGHLGRVVDVAWNWKDVNLLASVATEPKTMKIWDLRNEMAVGEVTAALPFSSLCWSALEENVLCVGGRDGRLRIFDKRKLQQVVVEKEVHRSNVGVVKYAMNQPNVIATGSDDQSITTVVVQGSEMKIVKRIEGHKNFVRALGWLPNKSAILSGGWDKRLVLHSL